MFKELRNIKIIISILLLGFVLYQSKSKYKFTQIVIQPTSFIVNENISLSITSNQKKSNFNFSIRNLISEENTLDTVLNINKTFDYFDALRPIIEGYNDSLNIFNTICSIETPGIYLCNNEFPFVVRSYKKSDVTIVCPIVNNHFYKESHNERIFEIEESEISTKRPVEIDQWSSGLKPFFTILEHNYNVNYASDLDLEDYSVFEKTKVVLLYGRLNFWSPKMMENIHRFVEQGGRLLIASSDVFHIKFCYNSESKSLSVLSCKTNNLFFESKTESWRKREIDSTKLYFNLNSSYGGESLEKKGYKIKEPDHFIFDDVNKDSLFFEFDYLLGSPVINANIIETAFPSQLTILAYDYCKENNGKTRIGGIIEYQNTNNGKIISLGSSSFCLANNQAKQEIQQVMFKSIEYLLLKY